MEAFTVASTRALMASASILVAVDVVDEGSKKRESVVGDGDGVLFLRFRSRA